MNDVQALSLVAVIIATGFILSVNVMMKLLGDLLFRVLFRNSAWYRKRVAGADEDANTD